MTTLNWDDLRKAAGESAFSPLPAAEYDAIVDNCEAKRSSSGKDMLAIRFAVETGPHAGRKVFSNFVISPDSSAALGFFFRKMAALGLDSEYFDRGPTLEAVASDLDGRRCRIQVTIREWNQQERNDISTVLPPADGNVVASVTAPGGMDMFATGGLVTTNGSHSATPVPPGLPF